MNLQPDEHILNIRKAISFIESKGENPTELDYSSALLISPYYIKYMPRDKITLNIYELAVSLDIDLSNSIPEFQDKMEKKINKVFNVIIKKPSPLELEIQELQRWISIMEPLIIDKVIKDDAFIRRCNDLKSELERLQN